MTLQDEIDAFHKQMRARALLIAIEWAGSASELASKIGYSRHAGGMWVKRAYITPGAAHLMEALPGFPVKALELCAGVYKEPSKSRHRCESCRKPMNLRGERTGYSSSFNDLANRLRKAEAAKRKKAKQQAAARKKKAAAKKRQTPA